MNILIEWVTQIIIFVLLASVVDLLIPATSMKKYVKLAVGLILILIFLKPVFYVFNMDVRQALEQSFTQLEKEQNQGVQTENLIKTQKNEIQDSQRAYILEQMAVQLKDVADSPLQQEYQQQITTIDFQMSQGADLTYENLGEDLENINVTLQDSAEQEEGVDVVEDVVIDTHEPSEDEMAIDVEGVKELLSTVWEIEKEKITIIGEGGAS
ncbi:stage III sporulation protein AF [Lentibacillus salinarum]|uniref:Stage III sporulation protein AF n=1 Tax=Lentibacillus salinarum TaxID=446820 RepID=A0ABW3ZR89_9BACI